MGIFDAFKSKEEELKDVAGGGGGMVAGSNEESAIGGLLGAGGLAGLMNKFEAGGLGDKMKSWIGKGDNIPVSEDEIESVVGSDQISAVASKLGVSPDEASTKIAKVLPTVIDKLTPDGVVPDSEGLAEKLTSFFKK